MKDNKKPQNKFNEVAILFDNSVKNAIKYLSSNAASAKKDLETVGLFRVPGNKKDVRLIIDSKKAAFNNTDKKIKIHDEVNVLKRYWRSVFQLYWDNNPKKAINFKEKLLKFDNNQDPKEIISLIPDELRKRISAMVKLARIIAKEEKNKMSLDNFGRILGQALFEGFDHSLGNENPFKVSPEDFMTLTTKSNDLITLILKSPSVLDKNLNLKQKSSSKTIKNESKDPNVLGEQIIKGLSRNINNDKNPKISKVTTKGKDSTNIKKSNSLL